MLCIKLIDSWAHQRLIVYTKKVGFGKNCGSLEALLRVGKMLKMATMLECTEAAGGLLQKLAPIPCI